MLLRAANASARALGRPCARARPLSAHRLFSGATDDSHDDFKPKKKPLSSEPTASSDVSDIIKKQISDNSIMLYMKGTPSQPQCGFSMQAVRILNAMGVEFGSVNVLQYPAIREGIKNFSDWPTIPQLYVQGEFIGGCDIMTSMYKEGELEALLKEKKLMPQL